MPRVHLTFTASREVDVIADYIAADRPSASDKWLREIYRTFELLAEQPEAGQRIDTKTLGPARLLAHGNYVIYFRPLGNGVQILRVIHGARDHEKFV